MARPPLVSILIPCRDERDFIGACLADALGQTYPELEIVVADGRSTDGSRALLAERAAAEPRLRVVDNPDVRQAPGLNRALAASSGEIVVRMDVHARYRADYVAACVAALERTGAANAGGAQRPLARTRYARAVADALTSPLGVGGARYRSAGAEGWVDTVYLGAFPRRVLEDAGGWDADADTNEDAELNQRIIAAGGRIWLDRTIVVHYFPRETARALARQYFGYGRGRARTALKHRALLTPRPAAPFALVLSGVALLVLRPRGAATRAAFSAYALATLAEAMRCSRVQRPGHVLAVWSVFPTLHVAHGLGFARGVAGFRPQGAPRSHR